MERNQAGVHWFYKAVTYSVASSIAGLAAGYVLGFIGSYISLEVRIACATLLAIAGIGLAVLNLSGRRFKIIQFDYETPQSWIHNGPIRWAIVNGLSLGFGAFSRLGFWLWYAVPLGAFLFADPKLGAVVYGAYATVRGMMVWILLFAMARWKVARLEEHLLRFNKVARVVSSSFLLLIAVATFVLVGL